MSSEDGGVTEKIQERKTFKALTKKSKFEGKDFVLYKFGYCEFGTELYHYFL